jgi:endonuclease/exonuclease/phosphatase (EEP) superfamily protein YafD
LELLSHFRVQYSWALALATVMFVACRQWRLATAGAAMAAVNLALIVPLYFGAARINGDQPLVRAMSVNVHYLNRNYDAVLALVRREKPDFVLLLEVTPEWVKAMGQLDVDYPFSRALPRYDAAGIALFSRLPIEQFEIRGRAEIGLPTFVAELALPTGLLTLIGTHPASPGSADHFAMRNRQFALIARWAREAPNPVMVLGDLKLPAAAFAHSDRSLPGLA